MPSVPVAGFSRLPRNHVVHGRDDGGDGFDVGRVRLLRCRGGRNRRDWDRWHSLFADGATLSAVVRTREQTVRRVLMTPQTWVEGSGAAIERDGFFEAEIGRVTEGFGLIAHAFSSYESYRSASDAEPFARGINSFQLMNDGSRWWVVSVFWQGEGPIDPIPAKYIGEPR